jgi:hypothetical protein
MRAPLVLLAVVWGAVSMLADGAAGVQWKAPAGWKALGAQPMRAATYSVAAVAGDAAASECAVYFFGAGQGGTVSANVDRWKGQFTDAAGKPATAKVDTRLVHGLKVTTVDTSGKYSGLGGPIARGAPVPGYRLLGAIVEAPGGNIFIKFTGPARTIAANQQQFVQFIDSFRQGS